MILTFFLTTFQQIPYIQALMMYFYINENFIKMGTYKTLDGQYKEINMTDVKQIEPFTHGETNPKQRGYTLIFHNGEKLNVDLYKDPKIEFRKDHNMPQPEND